MNATIDELNAEIEALKKTSKAKTTQQSSGNGGSGNTQPQTPPPAESQQPSSDDSTDSTDNPWGVVPKDASELDWNSDEYSDWVWE